MDKNAIKNTLKVIATFKELDYNGNVVTNRLEREIPWVLDSKKMLEHIIKHGTARGFEKPFGGYFNDLMEKIFNIKDHEAVWRPVSVESEVLSCGAKFVFQRHNSDRQVMEWEDVK